MKKVYNLIKSDLKTIYRDPIMLFILLSPLIIGIFFKYSFPIIQILADKYVSIDITKHYPFILGFLINLIPLLQGMLVGFMLLDVRDQKILQYLSVTPLTKSGYLLYKITTSVLSSFVFSYLVLLLIGTLDIQYLKTVPIILMASLQAPLIAVFLGAFASNKVEGIALSKLVGFILLAPIFAYLTGFKWHILVMIFPTYWVSRSFISLYNSNINYSLFTIIGLLYTIVLIKYIWLKYTNRIE